MFKATLAPAIIALTATMASAETYVVAPGTDAAEKLQEALILAEEGDIVLLAEGRYPLVDGLSLDASCAGVNEVVIAAAPIGQCSRPSAAVSRRSASRSMTSIIAPR